MLLSRIWIIAVTALGALTTASEPPPSPATTGTDAAPASVLSFDAGPWWIIGPFQHPPGEGWRIAHGPEANPSKDIAHLGGGEDPLSWEIADDIVDGADVDLLARYGGNDRATAYLQKTITCTSACDAWIALQCDDFALCWVNDERVLVDEREGAVDNPGAVARAALRAGDNRIMIKAANGVSAWGVNARIYAARHADPRVDAGELEVALKGSSPDGHHQLRLHLSHLYRDIGDYRSALRHARVAFAEGASEGERTHARRLVASLAPLIRRDPMYAGGALAPDLHSELTTTLKEIIDVDLLQHEASARVRSCDVYLRLLEQHGDFAQEAAEAHRIAALSDSTSALAIRLIHADLARRGERLDESERAYLDIILTSADDLRSTSTALIAVAEMWLDAHRHDDAVRAGLTAAAVAPSEAAAQRALRLALTARRHGSGTDAAAAMADTIGSDFSAFARSFSSGPIHAAWSSRLEAALEERDENEIAAGVLNVLLGNVEAARAAFACIDGASGNVARPTPWMWGSDTTAGVAVSATLADLRFDAMAMQAQESLDQGDESMAREYLLSLTRSDIPRRVAESLDSILTTFPGAGREQADAFSAWMETKGDDVAKHARWYLVRRSFAKGDTDSALAGLQDITVRQTSGSTRQRANALIGIVHLIAGRSTDAEAAFQGVMSDDSSDENCASSAAFLLGWTSLFRRDYAEARAAFDGVVLRFPQSRCARRAQVLREQIDALADQQQDVTPPTTDPE